MGWPDIFTQHGLFPGSDVQATQSNSNQSRSGSVVAINPTDTSNIIAASKKFIDPAKYHFTVAAVFSKNSGVTWTEATLPNPSNWDGMTDPVLAFNHLGNAFLVVEPLRFDPNDITVTGIQVFRSTNSGQRAIHLIQVTSSYCGLAARSHPPSGYNLSQLDSPQWTNMVTAAKLDRRAHRRWQR